MGDKNLAFVRKAREYAHNHPELVPGFLSLELFENDLRGIDTLSNLQRVLQPLVDNLEESLMLSGSEAYPGGAGVLSQRTSGDAVGSAERQNDL